MRVGIISNIKIYLEFFFMGCIDRFVQTHQVIDREQWPSLFRGW